MKNTIINIGKIILNYILFIIGLNMFCSFLLKKYCNASYMELLLNVLCNHVHSFIGESDLLVNSVMAVKNLIENIALAILASYIFTFILNQGTKIIFPEKLVLRRRTSEGSEGKLTLGILVGNPGKRLLLDVKCNVHCTYLKYGGEYKKKNNEIYLNQTIEFLDNYYRFSFEISKFPKIFWQHYLERREEYIEDDILTVTIAGKTDGLGGCFRVAKQYSIKDIIVDVHEPEKYFKKTTKSFLGTKKKIKFDWKKFPMFIEAGENERSNIIEEIKKYVGND